MFFLHGLYPTRKGMVFIHIILPFLLLTVIYSQDFSDSWDTLPYSVQFKCKQELQATKKHFPEMCIKFHIYCGFIKRTSSCHLCYVGFQRKTSLLGWSFYLILFALQKEKEKRSTYQTQVALTSGLFPLLHL